MDRHEGRDRVDQRPTARRYHAFLVRVWCEDDDGAWRASLQDAHAGARRGFADLDGLFAFLRGLCRPPGGAGPPPGDP